MTETAPLDVGPDDPRRPDVRRLLEAHLALMREVTPAAGVFALDVDALAGPDVSFCSARRAGDLVGVGALKDLGDGTAELKSMHTAAPVRRQGVAHAILEHLIGLAVDRGLTSVVLETGAMAAFAPARALYAAGGFRDREPFGPYVGSATSHCMQLDLTAPRPPQPHPA